MSPTITACIKLTLREEHPITMTTVPKMHQLWIQQTSLT